MNFFIFNKALDFKRGRGFQVIADGTGIRMKQPGGERPGIWISRLLDSQEPENRWHRLLVESRVGENMAFLVTVYGTDRTEEAQLIETMLNGNWEEVPKRLNRCRILELQNPEDALLHQVCCRYLWIGITLWGNAKGSPQITRMQIWFPQESWISYLPEFYQGQKSTFLYRYLAMFQTIYQEQEWKIRNSAGQLDMQAVEGEAFVRLAEWLNMDNVQMWPEKRLKRYLEHGSMASRQRGTRRGLQWLIECFTGEHPLIVEEKEHPYRFLLFMTERAVPTRKEYKTLLRIIREGIPAHMEVKLVILRPYLFLNQDSYLGINSVLGAYHPAVLDGISRIPLAVLGGKTT